jgi:hypothetical protein
MHDWSLVSIAFEWKGGCVTLEFKTDASKSATLTARGRAYTALVFQETILRFDKAPPSLTASRQRPITQGTAK